ncbi:hypothetical protein AWZ03_010644 [Drosophila navojoa]|uniref:Uncharacterized protein n=1 Tax=Drosophila navojoa TaxID=7232 RepID=A0A484B2S8_DRONA|nr:uncharacterized protein LOC108660107 [Drosophila navojoa]TDG42939.1 hypothetical protein AWZ03_010644 [Drosophila navojoa]
MKTVCFVVLCALLAVVCAAPAPAASPDEPTVSILRYRNDQELESIQRAIIAQYEGQLGGTTHIHSPRTASVVNPQTLGIHI